VALLAAPASASADTFVVNTTDDHVDQMCNADCTLRDATTLANGDDTIVLPAGIYNLDPVELDLTGATLSGAGARTTIIDGGNATRVLVTSNDTFGSPVISDVTIRRGNALGTMNTNIGGGIQVIGGTLTLVNSMVLNNAAQTDGGGIGLQSGETLNLIGSTVAGNSTGRNGGGIFSLNEGLIVATNSTISGNDAVGQGGGLYGGSGSDFVLQNATVAGNQGASGTGITSNGTAAFRNSILASNVGGDCSLASAATSNNTISSDSTCGLQGPGDMLANPGLGVLANNGGPTDTRAIGPTSPARDNGGTGCAATDQRGVARPAGACDIGAFEYRAPRLTVVKRVVNDEGGTQAPDDFTVHVRAGGSDVAGSPQPGTAAGRTYVLAPGSYTVGENADDRYHASFSGGCGATGAVTLAEGAVKTCTITNTDDPPEVGKLVNAVPDSGTVKIKLPRHRRFRALEEGDQLPVGTVVDTLRGRVTLVAAANKKGGTAESDFYDGIFKIGQTKGKRPITVLTLVEKLSCSKKQASAAAKKKKKRRLWGNGKGRFRTKGKRSAATVVGTWWLVEDRCDSTLTRVKRGKVRVRDFVKHKTVIVKAGHKYVARARRP
jgi:CSLREA domain-containing protein